MKNLTIFLLVFSMVFMACETDFEVNTSWKEVTIVYGLLDQSEAQQYIKINKAFLGEGDAFQMASVADSINYNPEDLEVIIYKVKEGAYDTIGFVTLDTTTSIIKDDGLFSTEKNIIYVTTKEDSNFFMANNAKDKEYILSIVNKKTQKIVSAKSNLIHTLNLDNNSLMKMGFYSSDVLNPGATPPYKKVTTTVNWKHSTNGYIYQIIGKICYRNYYNNGSNSLEYLDWIQPTQKYDGSSDMHYTFEGDAFANFISAYMPAMQDDIDYRKLAYMKLQYTVGSEDLHTYMVVNEPFEGIVQERPVFTNINNGIGLFSCRYNEIEIIQFSEATSKGLSLEFSNLGFN